MVTKFKIILLFIGIIFFINLNSCKKKCYIEYVFNMPINIYPQKDTFTVGDTIYIEINTPTLMYNSYEDNYVDLKEHGYSIIMNTYLITDEDSNKYMDYTNPGYNGSIQINLNFSKQFDVLPIKGNIDVSYNHYQALIEFDIEDGNFVNKSAIIIKDTGLFHFQFRDYYYFSDYDRPNLHPNIDDGDCIESWWPSRYFVNDGECNSNLLSDRGIYTGIRNNNSFRSETQKNNLYHGSWSFVAKAK